MQNQLEELKSIRGTMTSVLDKITYKSFGCICLPGIKNIIKWLVGFLS